MRKFVITIICIITGLMIIDVLMSAYLNKGVSGTISYTALVESIDNNEIAKISVGRNSVIANVTMSDGRKVQASIPSIDNLSSVVIDSMRKGKTLELKVNQPPSLLEDVLTTIQCTYWILIIGVCALCIWSIVKHGYNSKLLQPMLVNNSINIMYSNVKLSDFAGLENERNKLWDIVEFLKNPRKYDEGKKHCSKGIMLAGPDGTGKSRLVEAIAGEAKVPIFKVGRSFWKEVENDDGVYKVKTLFGKVKSRGIIFLDEIDYIMVEGHCSEIYRTQVMKQLVREINKLDSHDGIIVMATTSRSHIISKKLVKPGRLDYTINFSMPDESTRAKIFEIHTKSNHFFNNFSFDEIVAKTENFSGQDLKDILDIIPQLLQDRKDKYTKQQYMDDAYKIVHAKMKKSKEANHICAVHEAGHAIVSSILLPDDEIREISIVESEDYIGYNLFNRGEKNVYTKAEKMAKMAMMYAGKVAEEVVLNISTTGPVLDLKNASQEAYEIVIDYAMSDSLLTQVDDPDCDAFLKKEKLESAEKICQEAYGMAKDIIVQNRTALENLVNLLLKKEIINAEEIKSFMVENEIFPDK
ncbi:MAG: AAA family ATPase [Bacilli bacterium]|nr:AAA family ATPase [Bacilli bacterium]